MDRLPFTLPDFCRISWTSAAAQAHWSPRLATATTLLRRLEVASVRRGLRPAGLVCLPNEAVAAQAAVLAADGLGLLPLYTLTPRGYVSDLNSAHAGSSHWMCALGRRAELVAVQAAHAMQAHDKLGELFGYPACCRHFFAEIWERQRLVDTTWPMAENSATSRRLGPSMIELDQCPDTNLLLRWLGLRPVFHLPCAFDCAATIAGATALRELASELGESEALTTLDTILCWPVQWSALHGIAEIETPVVRITARTDATPTTYKVRLTGSSAEIAVAAHGTRFPFQPRPRRPKPAPARDQNGPAALPALLPADHAGSGFPSPAAMMRGIAPLIELVRPLQLMSLLHLGCKNGAIVQALVTAGAAQRALGLDHDVSRIAQARLLLPEPVGQFWAEDWSDGARLATLGPVDGALVMPGRLLELPEERAAALLVGLRHQAKTVIVYAFDDWLRKIPPPTMAERLGLQFVQERGSSNGFAAVLAPAAGNGPQLGAFPH